MFSKPNSSAPQPAQPTSTPGPAPHSPSQPIAEPPRPAAARAKGASLIAPDMVLQGDVTGGGDIQVDGVIKGDVRVEHVLVGEGGQIEGGVFAEAVEVRGKIVGSITAKQVRLYGNCHVDGDITHEQLAMETGAFFQGRSLRLQRPAVAPTVTPPAPRPESAHSPAHAPAASHAPATASSDAPAAKPAPVGPN